MTELSQLSDAYSQGHRDGSYHAAEGIADDLQKLIQKMPIGPARDAMYEAMILARETADVFSGEMA